MILKSSFGLKKAFVRLAKQPTGSESAPAWFSYKI
jgi:hypothetical protein